LNNAHLVGGVESINLGNKYVPSVSVYAVWPNVIEVED